jgi:hypothetical protein
MRVLHIEIEQIALEEHTVPADYGGVNIWTAKHLNQAPQPFYFRPVQAFSARQFPRWMNVNGLVPLRISGD